MTPTTPEIIPASDEHIENIKPRMAHPQHGMDGQALVAGREVAALIARIEADRARIRELEQENQNQAEELSASGRVRLRGEVWKLEGLLKEHRAALDTLREQIRAKDEEIARMQSALQRIGKFDWAIGYRNRRWKG